LIRVVFDTVIFVRALINPRGRWGRLIFDHARLYVLVASPAIEREVLEVTARPRLLRRYPQMAEPSRVARISAALQEAVIVEPAHLAGVSRDPGDDKFFACAAAGGAQYIVSEDKDVLSVEEYQGVRTVTAAEFLDLIT